MTASSHEITRLLDEWNNGDKSAFDELIQLVYAELRQMAHRFMNREKPGHTLQTTALINEVYLKLMGQQSKNIQTKAHFFGVAAHAMRNILVDYARSKKARKHGGGEKKISLDEALTISNERAAEIVALDAALNELFKIEPRKCRVVELRYFGGLSVEETARVLSTSTSTVTRDWSMAKAWLHRELNKNLANPE